jgi:hypothetical protein
MDTAAVLVAKTHTLLSDVKHSVRLELLAPEGESDFGITCPQLL